MDRASFQNGFVCGMATRGVIQSSSQTQPRLWNDEGDYSGFYIDFGMAVADCSLGQFTSSVYVADGEAALDVTAVSRVNATTFRVTCSLAGRTNGVQVYGRPGGYLRYVSGAEIPPFSARFFVAGLPTTLPLAYIYERGTVTSPPLEMTEAPLLWCWGTRTEAISEAGTVRLLERTAMELVEVSYS